MADPRACMHQRPALLFFTPDTILSAPKARSLRLSSARPAYAKIEQVKREMLGRTASEQCTDSQGEQCGRFNSSQRVE